MAFTKLGKARFNTSEEMEKQVGRRGDGEWRSNPGDVKQTMEMRSREPDSSEGEIGISHGLTEVADNIGDGRERLGST